MTSKKFPQYFTLILWKLVVSFTFSGCSRYFPGHPTQLRIGIDQEPATLDWNRADDPASELIISQMMEGLFSDLDTHENQKTKHLLNSSEVEQSIHLNIKPGIRWSDGVELTSQDYVDSWLRVLDPKTASPWAPQLFMIQGAEQWHKTQRGGPETVGIRATSPTSIDIRLTQPFGYFRQLLSQHFMYPIRKDLIALYGDHWTDPNLLVTIGPFKLAQWSRGDRIELTRNARYFDLPPQLTKLTFLKFADIGSALTLFDIGQLDVVPSIHWGAAPAVKELVTNFNIPLGRSFALGLRMKGAVADPRVRRALALAIDEKEILKETHVPYMPQKSLLPKALKEGTENVGLKFNIQEARSLLESAGMAQGSGLPPLRFMIQRSPEDRRIAENIQSQLKRNINVSLVLDDVDTATYLKNLKEGKADLWKIASPVNVTAHDLMKIGLSNSPFSPSDWSHPLYDNLVAQALTLSSPSHRRALYEEAQRLLVEQEAVVVPLLQETQSALLKPRIKGILISRRGVMNFSRTWIGSSATETTSTSIDPSIPQDSSTLRSN